MSNPLLNNETFPYICTPLTGETIDQLLVQLSKTVAKKPDLLEWRVDFFKDIANLDKVLTALKTIHENSHGIPILFTIRSEKEGGQVIELDEAGVTQLVAEVCKSEYIEMVDFELHSEQAHVQHICETSKKYGKKLILSYHNFQQTPPNEELLHILKTMESFGADVAKIAVMPTNKEDVFTLLDVTRKAKKLLSIPIITISMSDIGMISRIIGWYYGSCLTFAVGDKSSAPGQIPIHQLRHMIEMLKNQVAE